jgi:hypothetical protein
VAEGCKVSIEVFADDRFTDAPRGEIAGLPVRGGMSRDSRESATPGARRVAGNPQRVGGWQVRGVGSSRPGWFGWALAPQRSVRPRGERTRRGGGGSGSGPSPGIRLARVRTQRPAQPFARARESAS